MYTIVTKRAGDHGDPYPWVYDVLSSRGKPLAGAWNGWFATEAEALADARAWLADQSMLSAAL
jgi:hypothetical protein